MKNNRLRPGLFDLGILQEILLLHFHPILKVLIHTMIIQALIRMNLVFGPLIVPVAIKSPDYKLHPVIV